MQATKKRVVELNSELAQKLEILRYGEDESGFQRKVRNEKVRGILKEVHRGIPMAPIMVGYVDKRHIIYDGQHRFLAWQQKNFSLWVQIEDMTRPEMVEAFASHNVNATRISVQHLLNVSASKQSKQINEIAISFNMKPTAVLSLIRSLMVAKYRTLQLHEIENEDINMATFIIKKWAEDSRWKSKVQCYNRTGVLMMVGRMVKYKKTEKDAVAIIENLQKLNYHDRSRMYSYYSTTTSAVKKMMEYALATLYKKDLMEEVA